MSNPGPEEKDSKPTKVKKAVRFDLEKNTVLEIVPENKKGNEKAERVDAESIDMEEIQSVAEYLENHHERYTGLILTKYKKIDNETYSLTFAEPAMDSPEDIRARKYFKSTFMAEEIKEILVKMAEIKAEPPSKRPKPT